MLFNKKENRETVKKKKKTVERKVQEAAEQMAAVPVELPIEARQRPAAKEKRPSRTSRTKKKEPISVIDNWTGEDMVKGIVLSEILGPPKSKRKK